MRREDLTLIMLALADGLHYTPVQIQKAMFLLTVRAPHLFDSGSEYTFRPDNYGPFDKDVYKDIQRMKWEGLTQIAPDPQRGWNTYAATSEGVRAAKSLKQSLNRSDIDFLARVSEFVRRLSFSDLVSAIYKEYPEMRERSIFVGG